MVKGLKHYLRLRLRYQVVKRKSDTRTPRCNKPRRNIHLPVVQHHFHIVAEYRGHSVRRQVSHIRKFQHGTYHIVLTLHKVCLHHRLRQLTILAHRHAVVQFHAVQNIPATSRRLKTHTQQLQITQRITIVRQHHIPVRQQLHKQVNGVIKQAHKRSRHHTPSRSAVFLYECAFLQPFVVFVYPLIQPVHITILLIVILVCIFR